MFPPLHRLLYYLSAPRCVCCGEFLAPEDTALCGACLGQYSEDTAGECSLCHKPRRFCLCTNEYLSRHFVKTLNKTARYHPGEGDRPLNCLIFSLKRDHRRDVTEFLARRMEESLTNTMTFPDGAVFVPVPRRTSAKRRYGYDHAAMLAKELARRFHAAYSDCLVSHSHLAQKERTAEERLHNPDIRPKRENFDLSGQTVFLVDDVVTTGASMGTAAVILRSMGAGGIHGVCVAVSYRDPSVRYLCNI